MLAQQGRDKGGKLLFEELAGLVEIDVERDTSGAPVGATIAAPQPLSLGPELPVETVAACASLQPADIRVAAHKPVGASLGNPFVIAEVGPSALARATPDFPSFRQALEQTAGLNGRLGLYLYAHDGPGRVQARMFAPLGGTIEDPATGSAAGPLGALLLSLTSEPELRSTFTRVWSWGGQACCGSSHAARPTESGRPLPASACRCCAARRSSDLVRPKGVLLQGGQGDDVERDGMGGLQDDLGRHVCVEGFLPAAGAEAPALAGLRPGKPYCGIGVLRSLPRDLEKARNSASGPRKTVCRPRSSAPVLQQPSR